MIYTSFIFIIIIYLYHYLLFIIIILFTECKFRSCVMAFIFLVHMFKGLTSELGLM